MSSKPQYRFLVNEGDLMRMHDGYQTDVWWPASAGEPGRWSRYQLDVFNDSYSFITPDTCHDGHDDPCSAGQPGGLVSMDKWAQAQVRFTTLAC